MTVDFQFDIDNGVRIIACIPPVVGTVKGLFLDEDRVRQVLVRWYAEGGTQQDKWLREGDLAPCGSPGESSGE